LTGEYRKARRGIRFALLFTALLWLIKAYETVLSANFDSLGILPRTLRGSIGILTAPLIHGDIYHLISNTFPILVLVIGMFYFYHRIAPLVFFLIYFMTGFWVWIAARDAYHIGASGLVYGLISFLLFSGFLRRDVKTLAVSFAVLILYGSNMIYGLLPGNVNVSWESHVLGAVAGLFCAIYFKPKSIVENSRDKQLETENLDPFVHSRFYTYENKSRIEYHYKEEEKSNKYNYFIEDDEQD
jgi:membrane associated rhomboid family serine protease